MKTIKITYFLLIAIISSCSEVQNQNTGKDQESKETIINNEDLLSQFKEINFNSLWVYPDSFGNAPNYKFNGKALEKKYYFLFKDIKLPPAGLTDSVLSTSFKFNISKNIVGLICQTAGMDYSFASINLYIWDNKQKKIVNGFNLADNIEDAGGGYEYNSTIYRKAKDTFEITKKETNYQPNEREENEDITFNYKYSTTYRVITDSGFELKK